MTHISVTHEMPVFLKGIQPRYKVTSTVKIEENGSVKSFSCSLFYPNYYRGIKRLDWNYTDLKRQVSARFPSPLYRLMLRKIIKKMGNKLVSFEKELLKVEKEKISPQVKIKNILFSAKNESYEVEFSLLGFPYLFKQSLFYHENEWKFFSLYILKDDLTWSSFTEIPSLFFNEGIEKQLISFLTPSPSTFLLPILK